MCVFFLGRKVLHLCGSAVKTVKKKNCCPNMLIQVLISPSTFPLSNGWAYAPYTGDFL